MPMPLIAVPFVRPRRRPGRGWLAAAVLCCCAAPGLALAQPQAWPERPVHLVVPFAAGSAPDAMGRSLAESLARELGVPVIVENQPGAGGTIGVGRVARAPGDGYTLVLSGDAAIVGDARFGVKLPYDPVADLVPVSQIAISPNILVVGNAVPAHSLQELVALARSQPWGLSYASVGYGTSSHRGGELLGRAAGLEMVHVPGSASPLPDVVGGRVSMFFANAAALPLVREGKLRALAVSSRERLALAPELPTVAESGYPGFEAVAWFALFAPRGTPPGIVARLEAQARSAVAGAAVRERLQAMGALPVGSDAATLAGLVAAAGR
ncbi:Bug family tripartite tricarboxylate transporter substrate binding protein [Pseudorhodoferax sp.]|uniref:Bug family tripartite tricarboxylate transporter substrate binding protein n=1 Tax=Pseudorhodoferax sp. TaxID=1993553 RepID=UPI002DD69001|nr:tripartite tricarboxylate transporter substrate-binding protein [Pseudorhodoferax sp.]